MRLAVLASHEGMTLQAVTDACTSGVLPAEIAIVISNNSNSGAIRRAEAANLTTAHISGKTHIEQGEDHAILSALTGAGVDYVLLLGYMKKLGPKTLRHFQGRILNTHPSLLPKFGGHGFFGRRVHEAVLAAGDEDTGASIHLVDTEYDQGPLLAQIKVPVDPNDSVETLEARVKAAEQKLLVNTLAELAQPLEVSNY
ncbi:MAG: phosphoribosylglycinamide formyltransferase [Pseudomonadales bacterium]|nr:phosphoribosylglycinamide formyltransferase [Pseudomonadales bacterium]